MSRNDECEWAVAYRGIERFFDEGMTVWSKDKFVMLFQDSAVAEGCYVKEQLRKLEEQGSIELLWGDEEYLRVIRI
jgi:hypothetical protein